MFFDMEENLILHIKVMENLLHKKLKRYYLYEGIIIDAITSTFII